MVETEGLTGSIVDSRNLLYVGYEISAGASG